MLARSLPIVRRRLMPQNGRLFHRLARAVEFAVRDGEACPPSMLHYFHAARFHPRPSQIKRRRIAPRKSMICRNPFACRCKRFTCGHSRWGSTSESGSYHSSEYRVLVEGSRMTSSMALLGKEVSWPVIMSGLNSSQSSVLIASTHHFVMRLTPTMAKLKTLSFAVSGFI